MVSDRGAGRAVTAMRPDQVAGVRELVVAATAVDEVGPLSEQARLRLATARGTNLVIASADSADAAEIAGFAHLDAGPDGEPAAGELVVHPDHRRGGLGTALVHALEDVAGPGGLHVWAHGGSAAAVALADHLGYQSIRELVQMQVRIGGSDGISLPDLNVPDGLQLRAFRVGQDEDAWLAINARAFASHPEQGGWTAADLADREATDWFDPDGFLLVEDTGPTPQTTGGLAGFHWTKQHPRAGHSPLGEVYVLGVDPAYQGHGLGPTLTVAGLRYLKSRGIEDVMLYVDADNAAAVATYRRLGFERVAVDVMYARPGTAD
jgi:mycothiol synthase